MNLQRIAHKIAILMDPGPKHWKYWIGVKYPHEHLTEDEIKSRVKRILESKGYEVGDIHYVDVPEPGEMGMEIELDENFGDELESKRYIRIDDEGIIIEAEWP